MSIRIFVEASTVRIFQPLELWFKDVGLSGEAFGADGTPIAGDQLVWTTMPFDLHAMESGTGEVWGTGNAVTLRLHVDDPCGRQRHLVTLTATDGTGEHVRMDRRIITTGGLC